MPPIARIGSFLLVAMVALASSATVGAQVLIPEPNDGPMTGVTRTWLDASRRAAPPTDEDRASHPGKRASAFDEEKTPPVPPFEAPAQMAPNRPSETAPSQMTADRPGETAQSRMTVDPHVTPATRVENREKPAAAPETSDQEPKLLQSSDAIPLRRPEETDKSAGAGPESPRTMENGVSTWVTVGSSLAVVLGVFFVFAWIVRRSGGRSMRELPKEAVEVLGRASLVGRQQVHVIHFGNKIVLVAASPEHVEPLAEITEPVEVDRLIGLCRRALPGSASLAFQKAFRDLEKSSA